MTFTENQVEHGVIATPCSGLIQPLARTGGRSTVLHERSPSDAPLRLARAVDHPLHAELVDQGAEVVAPEHLLHRLFHFAPS